MGFVKSAVRFYQGLGPTLTSDMTSWKFVFEIFLILAENNETLDRMRQW